MSVCNSFPVDSLKKSINAQVPLGNRIYSIGDIHGRSDLLLDLARVISQDAASYMGHKTVVFLGDYIDRGMHSKQVIDILLDETFLHGFEKVFLCGNHEQTLLNFVNDDPAVLRDWWHYGAQATFFSYGVKYVGIPSEFKFLELQSQLKAALPISHLQFYSGLKQSFVAGDYFFVHAGIKPGLPLELQSINDCYWIRDEFLSSTLSHEKLIVHGHTIVPEPEILPNRIGIDTGAYSSGKLSCLVLEGDSIRLLNNYSVIQTVTEVEKPALYLVDTAYDSVELVAIEESTVTENLKLPEESTVAEPSPKQAFTEPLSQLMSKLADFDAALLITEDGFVIASSLPNHLSKGDVESNNLTLLESATKAFDVFNYGKLNELILQGEQGYTLIMNTGFGLSLLVSANRKMSLGQIMLEMRSLIEELPKLMLPE